MLLALGKTDTPIAFITPGRIANSPAKPPALPERIEAVLQLRE
jgi:hypothetical protein